MTEVGYDILTVLSEHPTGRIPAQELRACVLGGGRISRPPRGRSPPRYFGLAPARLTARGSPEHFDTAITWRRDGAQSALSR